MDTPKVNALIALHEAETAAWKALGSPTDEEAQRAGMRQVMELIDLARELEHELSTLRSALQAARAEALEEAAKACDAQGRQTSALDGQSFYIAAGQCANAIRALKSGGAHG